MASPKLEGWWNTSDDEQADDDHGEHEDDDDDDVTGTQLGLFHQQDWSTIKIQKEIFQIHKNLKI